MAKDARSHLGIFGCRNYGKSSLVNALVGQNVAIVSQEPGTTTDPVRKTMEVTSLGPVVLIDTAGIDDVGELGMQRVARSFDVLKEVDLAILVLTSNLIGAPEKELVQKFCEYKIPFFCVHNKSDQERLETTLEQFVLSDWNTDIVEFSAKVPQSIDRILDLVRKHMPESAYEIPTLLGDMVSYGDVVLLVTPIDIEAPKGRLILPQVQAIRDLLDNEAIVVVCKERELDVYWRKIGVNPKLVVTDSQAFLKTSAAIPLGILLTSFSIMLARAKGDFGKYLEGTPKLARLADGDKILILESCTHHVAGDDIGRVKIPRWIANYSGKKLEYEVVAGLANAARAVEEYAMVIQCGGCMLTRKQMINRLKPAIDAGIPVSNYGMTIAWCLGIFDRAVEPFVGYSSSSLEHL